MSTESLTYLAFFVAGYLARHVDVYWRAKIERDHARRMNDLVNALKEEPKR